MSKSPDARDVSKLCGELASLRSHCERVGDMYTGLALLFSAIGALVVGAGVWLHALVFALGAGFAFASAFAFAIGAGSLRSSAAAETPAFVAPPKTRAQPVIVPLRRAA